MSCKEMMGGAQFYIYNSSGKWSSDTPGAANALSSSYEDSLPPPPQSKSWQEKEWRLVYGQGPPCDMINKVLSEKSDIFKGDQYITFFNIPRLKLINSFQK